MEFVTTSSFISHQGSVLSIGTMLVNGIPTLFFSGPVYPVENAEIDFTAIAFSAQGHMSDVTDRIYISSTPSAVHAREFIIADFNGDRLPDFFSANHGFDLNPFPGEINTLVLSTQIGTIEDVSSTLPQHPAFTHSATAGDIDGDGDQDILVGVLGFYEYGTYFLINDGFGNFTQSDGRLPYFVDVGFDQAGRYTASLLADIDNDGSLDAIFGSDGNSSVAGWTYINNGIGDFNSVKIELPVGLFGSTKTITVDILPLDLNGDGFLDLVLSQTSFDPFYEGSKLQILINDGTGKFVDETDNRLLNQSNGVKWVPFLKTIDFEGDGDLDIISSIIFPSNDQVILWLNDGEGNFTDGTSFISGFENGITPVHLNEDGLIDFISVEGFGAFDDFTGGSKITTAISQGTTSQQWMGTYDIDFIDAGPQDDRITPLRGDDIVTGGAGLDTVVINSTVVAATITKDSTWTIVDSADGRDQLSAIERIEFTDGTVALDTAGTAGQTYRLYQAAFDRTPDTPGLAHNLNLLDGNLTLHDLSNGFIASAEFVALYGENSSNTTFLTALYANVLNRAPDPAGFDSWNNPLTSGEYDRADVLIGFSESTENIALVGSAIENGIWLG